MKIWNDNEVKALFENVERCKAENDSLVRAFSEHAKRFSRKPNSVRNYYYHEVDNLFEDETRAAKLKIDINRHKKSHFVNFDKVQEGELFEKIDKLTAEGLSVRAACLRLSGGDLPLMTRFQNKYQNMKRKLDERANSIKNQEKRQNQQQKRDFALKDIKNFDETSSKIIPFKVPHTLSDADINSLFLGLVRLIKKSAQDQAVESSDELKKALNKKDQELENLRGEFEKIKQENLSLTAKLQQNLHINKKLALERHLTENCQTENPKTNLQNSKRV